MFTGIVQAIGIVTRSEARGGDVRLSVDATALGVELALGDSLCVSGVCLTVVAREGAIHAFDVSVETLALTTLAALHVGDAVNLEPALRLSDRLGGHLLAIDGRHLLVADAGAGAAVELVEVDRLPGHGRVQLDRDVHEPEADRAAPDGTGHAETFPESSVDDNPADGPGAAEPSRG